MEKNKLDKRAFEYIKDVLEYKNKLSLFLLEGLDLSEGKAWTCLPFKLSSERLHKFTTGGVTSLQHQPLSSGSDGKYVYEKKQNLALELSDLIYNRLACNKQLCCVFDDIMVSPGESDLDRFEEVYRVVGEEIYHIVNQANLNKELIFNIINAVNVSWHFLCVVTELPTKKYIGDEKVLSKDNFLGLFSNIQLVIVGAYDGEGYVVWEKS